MQLVVEGQKRLEEADIINRGGIGQHLIDRFATRQVEIGRDRAILEIEVQKADARGVVLADRGQFPGEVHRQRRRAGAARKAVDRQDHAIAVALRLETRRRGVLFHIGVGAGCLLKPLDRLMQGVLGKRVGDEIVGAKLEKLMERDRADLFGDEDDLHPLLLGGRDDARDSRQIVFVIRIDRHRDEFERVRIGLVQKEDGVIEGQIAPAFAKLRFHVLDQKIEVADITRDRTRDNRRRFRLQRCNTAHSHTSFFTWSLGMVLINPLRHRMDHFPNPNTPRDSQLAPLLSTVKLAENLGNNGAKSS